MRQIIQPIQKLSHCFHIALLTLTFGSGLVFPVKINAEAGRKDPADLLRAGRWGEIRSYFRSNKPSSDVHRYVQGRAAQEKAKATKPAAPGAPMPAELREAADHYLSILELNCATESEEAFKKCISDLPDESVKDTIDRLAVLKLSALLKQCGWNDSRLKILSKPSLETNDPLSGKIYTEKLETLLARGQNNEARDLAARLGNIDRERTHFYRARAYVKGGQREEGWNLYLLAAANSSDDPGMLRSVYQDVRFYFPQAFRSTNEPHSMHRNLVHFWEWLSPAERASYQSVWPAEKLLQTASPNTALHDGLMFIQTGQDAQLIELSKRVYTHLSREGWILNWWTSRLLMHKRYATIEQLLTTFDHVKKQEPYLWKMELQMRQAQGDREKYFRSILAYLSVFNYDYEIHDQLIEWLIGDNDRQIRWAPSQYWELARQTLPAGTGNGRFIYWLHRYYLNERNTVKAAEIEEKFYELAPGSYYARAFWDEKPAGDFRMDWKNVRDRPTYLRWVARHGSNEAAVAFIANKDVSSYYDPATIALWKRLQSVQYSVPEPAVLLFKLGEFDLGQEFFDFYFKDKLSRKELFLRRVVLGIKSGNLSQSVWHLRQIARDENIPEDPFSMPAVFLKELYPRPYLSDVKRSSAEFGVQEEMIYALMRQESMFREIAVSRSGALGLMQVMPATGKWLTGRMGIKSADLLEPAMSIRLGAKFFSDLMRESESDFRWASIAYNGGPGSLRRWKAQYYHGDFNLFLENIPSKESRNYCRATFQNYWHYRTTYLLYPSP